MNPLSLSVTNCGRTFSTSCAITPTFGNDCCNSSALSFQFQVTPLSDCTFSIGLEISSILSFNLSSEEAYATTSPPTFNAPAIPTPPSTINAPVVLLDELVASSILSVPNVTSSPLPNPKLPAVNVLVETLPFASVTRPLVSVVILKSKSEITVAPVSAPVSIFISSPAKLVGKT